MFKAARNAALVTTASLFALGTAIAQETEETQDAVETETSVAADSETSTDTTADEAQAQSERKALTESELTTIAEDRLAEADADGDEALNEEEYASYTRAFAGDLKDDYGARLDTRNEVEGSGTRIDVTSSGSIEEMRKRNTASVYDNAVAEDKIETAAAERFTAINIAGTVTAGAIVSNSSTAFREADANGDELIEGDELDRYASAVTGLGIETEEETEVEEIETDSEIESEAQG